VVVILRIVRSLTKGIRSVRGFGLVPAFALIFACSPAAGTRPVVDPPTLEVPRLANGNADSSLLSSGGGARFGRAPITVGSKWAVTTDAQSAVSMADPQGVQVQVSEYVSRYSVEILAVEGPAPTRVRLSFQKNVQRYQSIDKPTVIDGKTYVVDRTPPHVRDEAGAQASEEETQRVLDVFPDLGTRTQIDQVLPESAMQIGQERHELADAILRVIHPRAWTMTKGTASLARTEGEDAVFDVTLDANGQSGVHMEVKGEARVRLRDAKLVSITLAGAYTYATDKDPGTFTLKRTVRDLSPN
jgi:hypothetical protein